MTVININRHLPIAEKQLLVLEPGFAKHFSLKVQIFHPQLDHSLSRIWQCKVRLSGLGSKQQSSSLESLGMCSLQALTAAFRLVAGAINLMYGKGYRFLDTSGNLADENFVRQLFLTDLPSQPIDGKTFGRRLANGMVIGHNVFSKESVKTSYSLFVPMQTDGRWSCSFSTAAADPASVACFRATGTDSFDALVACSQIAFAEFKQKFETFSIFQSSEKEAEKSTFQQMREILFSCCGSDSTDFKFVLGERFLHL